MMFSFLSVDIFLYTEMYLYISGLFIATYIGSALKKLIPWKYSDNPL